MEGKKQEAEEDQTTGKGDGYGQTELRLHTDRNTVAISQNHSNNSMELWLHLDGTEVTAGRNRSKLLVRMLIHCSLTLQADYYFILLVRMVDGVNT